MVEVSTPGGESPSPGWRFGGYFPPKSTLKNMDGKIFDSAK